MKGNEAIGEAAIRAGCRYFFGYPITPQTELPEYLVRRLPKVGGVFLQAESEIAAINMVYGASAAGARVMTSSSSPGISLKQEGISYLAGSELPCVIVNIMRGGPGLGGIQPAQGDYFQATRGGGHGDYRLLVYAPGSVQELADLTIKAFDRADAYRNPVMILGDGILGQMMEPVEFKEYKAKGVYQKPWATTGTREERKPNIVNSLYLDPEELEEHNYSLLSKYETIEAKERLYEQYLTSDADIVLVAFGTTARIAKAAVKQARERDIKAGLFRPITLWPFPDTELIRAMVPGAKAVLTVELSMGQLVDDVRLAVGSEMPVYFYGRAGGMVPSTKGIYQEICRILGISSEVPPVLEKGVRYSFQGGGKVYDKGISKIQSAI